jgi:hypothetical protein
MSVTDALRTGSPEPAFVIVPEILDLGCWVARLAAVGAAGAPARGVVCCCWAPSTAPVKRKRPLRKTVFFVTLKDTLTGTRGYEVYKFLQEKGGGCFEIGNWKMEI